MIKEVLNAPAKQIILERAHIGVIQFRKILSKFHVIGEHGDLSIVQVDCAASKR